jgi:hypothetical protein
MRCQIRENLERAKSNFDVSAYGFALGSEQFDHCLAGSIELNKALADHKAICPVCGGRDSAIHAA